LAAHSTCGQSAGRTKRTPRSCLNRGWRSRTGTWRQLGVLFCHLPVEFAFAGMAERRIANIVSKTRKLHKIGVNVADVVIRQDMEFADDRLCDSCDFYGEASRCNAAYCIALQSCGFSILTDFKSPSKMRDYKVTWAQSGRYPYVTHQLACGKVPG
jgi:hypothetical protein